MTLQSEAVYDDIRLRLRQRGRLHRMRCHRIYNYK